MATGRGQTLDGSKMGREEVNQAHVRGLSNRKFSNTKRLGAHWTVPQKPSLFGSTNSSKKQVRDHQKYIERMPPEILLKILSYLDSSSLFCMGFVNKQFQKLTNNNSLWYKMYLYKFETKKWKTKQIDEVTTGVHSASIQDIPEGYWKKLFFRKLAGYNENKWERQLRAISPYTGLPSQTEKVLRSLAVKWEMTVTDNRGHESTFEQSHARFSDSSVTVTWINGSWPSFKQLSTLALHGVIRLVLDCPAEIKPGRRSLIAKLDVDRIRETGKVIGSDKIVELFHLPPGLLIGIWQGEGSIAFVMVNFHFHKLVERSLLGSSICPYALPENKPLFDDLDPEYGLHGYTLHISLDNTAKNIMSGRFSQLFCRKDQIRNGFVPLRAIDRRNLSQHTPLSGGIYLPWKTQCLDGKIQNCCMLSLTILDETPNPFWCVSVPVTLSATEEELFSYDYKGENFCIEYEDSQGKVKMDLVRLQEPAQFFLINLVVYIRTARVKEHFRRAY